MNRALLLLFVILIPACRQNDDGMAGKSAAEGGDTDKTAAEKAAAEKAAAEKAAAEKAAAEKVAAEKAARAKRIDMAVVLDHMGKYLYENKLELTGGVGSNGGFAGGGRTWANYRDSLHEAAGADRAIRAVHTELWQLIDNRKWEATGTRKLAEEQIFRFEVRYAAGDLDGVITVSFLPFEGKWPDKGKKPARLEVKVSEMPRKK